MTKLIEIENLEKRYGDGVVTRALAGVTFDIDKGDFVSIMGPSGSGKSTLMHILGFLDRPTSGIYKFKGRRADKLSDEELAEARNEDMGFVFQSFNLLSRATVFENVRLPLVYSKVNKKDQKELIMSAIKAVGLEHRVNHLSNQLSGGEQERVATARAIVMSPDVVFADEPTGNLDSKSGQQVMGIFQKLNDEGRTVILVTHENHTARHAKRIIKLMDGEIISDEKVKDRVFAKSGELIK